MNQRPRSITVIGWLFVAFGCVGLIFGLRPLLDAIPDREVAELSSQRMAEIGLVSLSQMLAAVAGAFLLRGFNWARWLLVTWLAFHVILGLLHGPFQLLVHSLLFVVLLYFLFRPQASAFFH